MTNLNLAINNEGEKPTSSLAREWTACIVVIVLLLLTYAGLAFYNRSLTKNIADLNEEYGSQYNSLMESGKNVFDFQNRLEVAKPLVLEKNHALESLNQIGKMIIPGVYAESFTWDAKEKKISLECVSGEYRLVANQLASLKKSDYFSKVAVNDTKTREDGKISFLVELVIKK